MCGIAGQLSLGRADLPELGRGLEVMSSLLAHRGPDAAGVWRSEGDRVGFAHRRLAIIDLSEAGNQPMSTPAGTTITFNGEIYNHTELRADLGSHWSFQTKTDTEVILAAYDRAGPKCVDDLRGMFAFALWDGERLFGARDRFGIKPFYYAIVDGRFLFASEIKALLPFLPAIETDPTALAEYLVFQYTLGEKTLFKGVKQLLPGHALAVEGGEVKVWRYWDVRYEVDLDHSPRYFEETLQQLVGESLEMHLRSDVPVGSYLSGGIDSSLISILASDLHGHSANAFHGKFSDHPGYDESRYATLAAARAGATLREVDITAEDFRDHIAKVIYHLDQPVAGPGSFPQFMVSGVARQHVKVVLGGQGGDEIFGGYARYLVAYLEQCLRAAIDGTYRNGNFVVTPESIVPNLTVLQEYTPLLQQLWREGLFGPLDQRYFRLVDRSHDLADEIQWSELDLDGVHDSFDAIFNSRRNVAHEAYFDSMTHFDFKCLLPALLHVEDRMSMAHGLESRVPFIDHPLVEFAATIPADVKFRDGRMKHLLKQAYSGVLPTELLERRDKMGFPVPLNEWLAGPLRDWVNDLFRSGRTREFLNNDAVLANLEGGGKYGRKMWGLMSLELWHQCFHDRAAEYRRMLD